MLRVQQRFVPSRLLLYAREKYSGSHYAQKVDKLVIITVDIIYCYMVLSSICAPVMSNLVNVSVMCVSLPSPFIWPSHDQVQLKCVLIGRRAM